MLLYFLLGVAFLLVFKFLSEIFAAFTEFIISAFNVAIANNNKKVKLISEEENTENKIGF